MYRHGWEILFHQRAIEQLQRLRRAHKRALRPNANSKLYETLARTMLDTVAVDPSHTQYRQGNIRQRYRIACMCTSHVNCEDGAATVVGG